MQSASSHLSTERDVREGNTGVSRAKRHAHRRGDRLSDTVPWHGLAVGGAALAAEPSELIWGVPDTDEDKVLTYLDKLAARLGLAG